MTDNLPTTDLARAFALRIAHESPTLEALAPAELERLARVVVAENLRDDLKRRADVAGIDYQADRERFLAAASRTNSARTRDLYQRALARLEAWCATRGISVLELTPALADDWIAARKADQGRCSPNSVNIDVAAASVFWSRLERWHTTLRNPFRGTRARPQRKAVRKPEIPDDKEIRALERAADPVLRAAIVLMSQGGLRVGALRSLSIGKGKWTAVTKGKEQDGAVPAEAPPALKAAGLSAKTPFAGLSATQVSDRFRYLVRKLHKAGKLRALYSVHDLRHAFAHRLYGATHDIYQVKQALGHAGVSVTETYLRSLGETV